MASQPRALLLTACLATLGCAGAQGPRRSPPPFAPAHPCDDSLAAIGEPVPARGSPGEVVGCARDAHGLRISYRTTRSDGAPAIATARVVLPSRPSSLRPSFAVVAHGTTGVADRCAPSLGSPDEMTRSLAARGWPVIAPDYAGLGSPGVQGYGDNEDTARSVLDAARALRSLLPADALSAEPVLVGHSQGGGAVLSAQAIARRYLAGDAGLAAVIAIAPGWPVRAQLDAAARDSNPGPFGDDELSLAVAALFLYTWHARTYGDARAGEGFAVPHRQALVHAIETGCVSSLVEQVPRLTPSLRALVDPGLLAGLVACATGVGVCGEHARALHEWSRANLLHADPDGAPIHVIYGSEDAIITPERIQAIADQLRADRLEPTLCRLEADHLSVVAHGMPHVIAVAEARTTGSVPPTCGLHERSRR